MSCVEFAKQPSGCGYVVALFIDGKVACVGESGPVAALGCFSIGETEGEGFWRASTSKSKYHTYVARRSSKNYLHFSKMTCLVMVGTTKFNALIEAIDTAEILSALATTWKITRVV
jgi:hypothetical protein